jgi:predicted ATPase
LADSVLRGAPGVKVLATSREPLRIEGEQVYRLPSLETPPAARPLSAAEALEFPSVQLFAERAAAAMSEYELTDAEAPIVAEICRKLDGLPLAIEFAAARVDTFGIQGVASRLDDRMRLLTAGRRGALPRHHTMRAVLDCSYDLLSEAEQKALQRISVFSGSFTLEAACAVSAVSADATHPESEVLENITALVAKSLISADFSGVEPRFRLLETTRAYALAKLAESGENEMLGRRHAEYYRDLLNAAAAQGNSRVGFPCIGPELDNIRVALRQMYKQKRGCITYMGSVRSKEASLLKAPYVTANHGLVDLAKVVATEEAAHGIRANVIGPGFVWTPLVDKQIPEQAKALGISEQDVIRNVLLKDTVDGEFTTVDDLAKTALFLAAFGSNALTGQME